MERLPGAATDCPLNSRSHSATRDFRLSRRLSNGVVSDHVYPRFPQRQGAPPVHGGRHSERGAGGSGDVGADMSGKWRAIALIAACEVMTLSMWFSATAVLPALKAEGGLDGFHASLFTSLVAIGFVCGTLTSALLGLADRWELHRFFRASAAVAALANLGLLAFAPASGWVLACRFATGFCMAGILQPLRARDDRQQSPDFRRPSLGFSCPQSRRS